MDSIPSNILSLHCTSQPTSCPITYWKFCAHGLRGEPLAKFFSAFWDLSPVNFTHCMLNNIYKPTSIYQPTPNMHPNPTNRLDNFTQITTHIISKYT